MKALLKALLALIKAEPALALGVVAAAITLAAAFGLNLGDKEQAAIMALAQALLALLIRSQVSPAA